MLGYIFEWDAKKTESNFRKNEVTFDEACTPLQDSLALMPDPDHSVGEERYIVLGMSNRQRLLVVSFAERSTRTRLISARKATRQERKLYEES